MIPSLFPPRSHRPPTPSLSRAISIVLGPPHTTNEPHSPVARVRAMSWLLVRTSLDGAVGGGASSVVRARRRRESEKRIRSGSWSSSAALSSSLFFGLLLSCTIPHALRRTAPQVSPHSTASTSDTPEVSANATRVYEGWLSLRRGRDRKPARSDGGIAVELQGVFRTRTDADSLCRRSRSRYTSSHPLRRPPPPSTPPSSPSLNLFASSSCPPYIRSRWKSSEIFSSSPTRLPTMNVKSVTASCSQLVLSVETGRRSLKGVYGWT